MSNDRVLEADHLPLHVLEYPLMYNDRVLEADHLPLHVLEYLLMSNDRVLEEDHGPLHPGHSVGGTQVLYTPSVQVRTYSLFWYIHFTYVCPMLAPPPMLLQL